MSSLELTFFDSATMGQAGSIERLLDTLDSIGYELKVIRVGEFGEELKASWDTYGDIKEGDLQVAYEHRKFALLMSGKQNDITATVDVQWPEDTSGRSKVSQCFLKVSTHTTAMFTQKEYDSEKNCEILLALAKQLYELYAPKYGWIERGLWSGYTGKKDIEALAIPHIYWANFFGPDYVAKYGKEFFQHAPGWYYGEMRDGGCMYVLSPDINRNKAGVKQLEQAVCEYFGVEQVRKKSKPRKKPKKPARKARKLDLSEDEMISVIYNHLRRVARDDEER
ncbi:MAG: hypothetical protein OEZ02_11755 [Anaerolineae bacterium]|nr:hypothetical protein [Anaerolineae bacterium]